MITVTVERREPGGMPHLQAYAVPFEGMVRVMDLILHIYHALDPTLGFRRDLCRDGVCDGCMMKINGRVQLACLIPIPARAREMHLAPAGGYPVLRDLVVDFAHPLSRKGRRHA
jgi:succinate dehydrogenase/fumarate reductase-like Fe-S protein